MEQKTPREDMMAEAKTGPLFKTGMMAGKRGLIMGVANDHSIAWGIAQVLAGHPVVAWVTYQWVSAQRSGPCLEIHPKTGVSG